MIEIEGLRKTYGEAVAVDDLDLVFDTGRTTALIGPSGCGKSTLLRLMLGLIEKDKGRVIIDGELLSAANVRALRHRIGYVIQSGGLFPHLSVSGNACLLARYLGWSRERRSERLGELAELVRLPPELLERYPLELSGGQQQRVALMRALMLDPPILLMDEPLGALDPMIRADLQAELRDIFARLNKTVVIVTHDMHEAAFFAETIVLMRGGRIVQKGPFDELRDRPADPFVRAFMSAQHMAGESP